MYCKECGAELSNDESKFCTSCGVKKENGNKFCQACGTERVNPNQEVCLNCGVEFKKVGNGDKKKTPALLLALFLGGFGAHLFYVARARKDGGTGLGLSIAKWIIDNHKGYFGVLSRKEIGTRITVYLPQNIDKES